MQYKGREMKEIHKNLGIGNDEFDEFLAIIEELLKEMNVDAQLTKEVLEKLNTVRNMVVFKK